MKHFMMAAIAAAALLSACGGGGNSGETKASITSVKVIGASLADSGTFGYKYTVQPAGSTTYQVYTERLASTYGLPLCNAFSYASSTFSANAGCTNYAVAGAKVNNTVSNYTTTSETSPLSGIYQLQTAGSVGFSSSDLVIVGELGANDAADVATAYLTDLQSSGSTTYFSNLATTLLGSTVVANYSTYLASSTAAGTLGSLYMQALADKLFDAVVTNALNHGAQRIAVLNTLDITKTPKFQRTLTQLTQGYGATTANGIQTLIQTWVQAYNTRLATRVASYSGKVVVVDFYTGFNDEMASPSQYGLSNTSMSVCDQTYGAATAYTATAYTAGAQALSTSAVRTSCTDSYASSITPTSGDGTSNWWKTYLFADNFHPTPYGHQLLGQLVAKRLTEAGWL